MNFVRFEPPIIHDLKIKRMMLKRGNYKEIHCEESTKYLYF